MYIDIDRAIEALKGCTKEKPEGYLWDEAVQQGYNKAIDDCIKVVEEEEKQHNHIITKGCLFWLKREFEQLKAGVNNGTDNQ